MNMFCVSPSVKLVNKKDQKSLSGSATVEHRDVYSGTVDLLHSPNWNGARNIKLKPTVLISAPNWKVFEFSGDMDYKPNKLIKANTVISMDKFLKKPIKLDSELLGFFPLQIRYIVIFFKSKSIYRKNIMVYA